MSASADNAIMMPPWSLDAEQSVLGALMLSPAAMARVADWLSDADFYRKDHRLIFRAIVELMERNAPCDPVTLGDWFAAQGLGELIESGYVLHLANTTPSAANVVAYGEIVLEHSRKRAAIDIGTTLTSSAFKRETTAEECAAAASHALATLQLNRAGVGLVPTRPTLKRVAAEITRRYMDRDRGLIGLPTPWAELNRMLKGWRNGLLYVLAGRPSMGKTITGAQIAGFLALRGHRGAFFSLEMTADEILGRLIACHGEIPHEFVDAPSDCDDAELYWGRLTKVVADLAAAPLMIDDEPAMRVEQIVARARREHLKQPLEYIVIDHLHEIAVDPKVREVRHEFTRIVQALKALAKQLNIPVILLAQLSRAVAGRADKRPTLTDLRESGAIEEKADVVLFIHREDYYDAATYLAGAVELIVGKGRNLPKGRPVTLANRYDQMRIDDWSGDYPEPPAEPTQPRRKANRGYDGAARAAGSDR